MTKDGSNARKQAARRLAEAEQIPYTEALRRLGQQAGRGEAANRPPAAPYAPPAVRVGPPVPTLAARTTLRGHTNRVCGAFLAPDGRTLASGGDITARIWDLESAETTVCLYLQAGVAELALSPDGRTVAVGGFDGSVLVWDLESGQTRSLAEGRDAGSVDWMSFPAGDAHTLAVGRTVPSRRAAGELPRGHAAVEVWDPDAGTETLFDPPSGRVLAVAPQLEPVVVGTQEGIVRLYSAAGEPRAELTGHTSMIDSVAISPDGRILAASAADCTVRLWDLTTTAFLGVIEPHGGYVTALAFNPENRILATGTNDGVTRLWDAATGQQTATLLGHSELVTSLSFSADGKVLVTASMDATIRLWTVA